MSETSILEKACGKCQEVFPNTAEYFYRRSKAHRSKTDPFRTSCKKCHAEEVLNTRKDCCQFCHSPLKGSQRRGYCSTRCKVLAKMGGIGAQYGRLTIVEYAEPRHNHSHVLCRCECGNETSVWIYGLRKGTTRSCGCLQKEVVASRIGEKHPLWAGGRQITKHGYVLIKKPGHPNAQAGGYIFEHVFLMAEFLGRPLRPNENVHHRNGHKSDNSLGNLELWVTSQPQGQRSEDIYEWAKEFIKMYDADVKKLARRHLAVGEPQLALIEE